jgi:type I restriction enzyme S subunit
MSSRTKTTATKEEAKPALVPKLRFPEFLETEGWNNEEVRDLLDESRTPSLQNDPSRRITVRLHLQGVEHREHRGTESTESTNNFCRKVGQFIYGKQNIHKGAFGIIPSHLHGFETSQDLPCFDFKDRCCAQWLYYHFSREAVYSPLELKMTGTGSKRLNEKSFLELAIAAPEYPEQQKIAECLSSVDELIAAQARKLDALKNHKKGLMEQLFPREGETQPRFRFPEFQNAGEWEVQRLDELAHYENGKAHENDISENGRYIVVNSKFISTEGAVRKFSNEGFCVADKGDVLMVLSDVPNGRAIAKCYFVESDDLYTVNQRICRIRPTKVNGRFLFYLLDRNSYFLNFDDGIKQTNLRKEDVVGFPLCVPAQPDEQQRIASCLSSLDALITSETQKLEALKTHKKGLMQQLFPSPEEVAG